MGVESARWGDRDNLWTYRHIGFASSPVLISGSRVFRSCMFLVDRVVFFPLLFKLLLLTGLQNLPLMSHAPPAQSIWFQGGGARIPTPSGWACDSGVARRAGGVLQMRRMVYQQPCVSRQAPPGDFYWSLLRR